MTTVTRSTAVSDRIPPPLMFMASGLTQYSGAALAVGLFAVIPAQSVAWWRIAFSAIVLLLWRRPWRQTWTRQGLLAAALFGVVLTTMNIAFYIAIDHLPLGTSVAIEFIGPVAVAAISGRGWRERVSIVLAAAGVVALAGVSLQGGWTANAVIGLVAILATAAAWAGYILLGRRVARGGDGISSLAVGMTVGAVLYCPLAIGATRVIVHSPRHLLALVGIAVFSSVIPYAIEQVIMRRVSAARFAILLALLPVAATVVGAVILAQIPGPLDLAGIGAICGAVVLSAQRPGRPEPGRPKAGTQDEPAPLP
ncbi:inner membrane transporter RhtA [Nakamurella sp. UYEF19]|uniref:EamA family transporter n=1 Tax=Nakamurella sp. UYEF19 TaxID=1756392 RepID=UPI0033959284